MQDYQQRVVDEKAELDAKQEKLRAFVQSPGFFDRDDISPEQRSLLIQQEFVMRVYSEILWKRIQTFEVPVPAA